MSQTLTELRLTHLNLDSRDLDAAQRFYGEQLRLPVVRRDAALRVEHPDYLLVINEGTPNVAGTFHFGFRVPEAADVDAWIARLRTSDVPIVVEPAYAGHVYVARICDPDGHHIEIYAEM